METATAKNGKLISFEGIECSGKGTQIKLVQAWLKERNIPFVSSHEPGGALYPECIRGFLKNPQITMQAIQQALHSHSDYETLQGLAINDQTDYGRSGSAEMFLYLASRSEYAAKILKPALTDNILFISDRLMDSTIAYQGGGHFQSDPEKIKRIIEFNRFAMDGLWPDLTLFLDIPVEVMYERMASQSAEKNSFFEEKYDRLFYQRVRQEYLNIAQREPARFKIIDGTQPISEVFELVKEHLELLTTNN